MEKSDFQFITQLVKTRSGIDLGEDKLYLLESRLTPLARAAGFNDLPAFIASLRTAPKEKLFDDVVEAMTTNESFFFRDTKPFEHFRKTILPQILENAAGKKHFRVWSAAASTGQEAYTILMCLKEDAGKLAGWTYDILGTDIAPKVVDRAKQGAYSQFEVQRGLPIQMLMKYFVQDQENWKVKDELRNSVKFQTHNLLLPAVHFGVFDIIFCRNVLIYFDEPTKAKVLSNLHAQLAPGGFLVLGSAETLLGSADKFKPLENERGYFVKV